MSPASYFIVPFAGLGAAILTYKIGYGLVSGSLSTVDGRYPRFERHSHPFRYWAWIACYIVLDLVLASIAVGSVVA